MLSEGWTGDAGDDGGDDAEDVDEADESHSERCGGCSPHESCRRPARRAPRSAGEVLAVPRSAGKVLPTAQSTGKALTLRSGSDDFPTRSRYDIFPSSSPLISEVAWALPPLAATLVNFELALRLRTAQDYRCLAGVGAGNGIR